MRRCDPEGPGEPGEPAGTRRKHAARRVSALLRPGKDAGLRRDVGLCAGFSWMGVGRKWVSVGGSRMSEQLRLICGVSPPQLSGLRLPAQVRSRNVRAGNGL